MNKPFKSILKKITQLKGEIMAAIDDLNAAVTALQATDVQVVTAISALNQKVADLTAALATATATDPQVAAAAAAVKAESDKLTAAIAPQP